MMAPAIRQRGVALLVALLVVALAVILIAALLDRGELALARTRNTLRSQQAEAYALGLEVYAAQILLASHAATPGPDTNASPWALPLPPQPVPGGVIAATMRDLNGCFNLNNLAPPAAGGDPALWEPVFARLLATVGVTADVAGAVEQWIVPDPGGAATSYYLALPVPYRPRGGLFAHVSELRLVRGVSGEAYARLAPYVCALPPGTRINVNTAGVPMLQSMADGISQAVAGNLWRNGAAQWDGADQFVAELQRLGVAADPQLGVRITTTSRYFLADSRIVLDTVPFTFHSLIEYGNGGIHVLERSRGSDDALVAAAPIAAQ